MIKVTFDMETRSTIDLIKCGMYRYAEDPTTDIFCIAVKVNGDHVGLWVAPKFCYLDETGMQDLSNQDLCEIIDKADIIEAHNHQFEYALWMNVMVCRYGFPPLPLHKLRCSAAKAANFAIPRSLKFACKAMLLSEQKDDLGGKIMRKMCKPRNPLKADKERDKDWADKTYWHENPEEFEVLLKYCKQDVESEHALSESLYPLSAFEQEVFELDHKINLRGIRVDLEGINELIDKLGKKESELLLECQTLTNGIVNSPKQVMATQLFLKDQGVELENLQKGTVEKALKGPLPRVARRLLEIRQILSKSSVAKLDAMKRMACIDERVRGIFLYCGARTKRWCLDAESEMLTPYGWVRYDQLLSEPIAVWDSETKDVRFEDVKLNVWNYEGEMNHTGNAHISFKVTPDHTIPYFTARKNFTTVKASEALGKRLNSVPLSGNLLTNGADILKTRILVMVQADGSFRNDSSGRLLRFHLKKKSKIDRCEMLLSDAGILYRKGINSISSTIRIIVNFTDMPYWLRKFEDKQFGNIPFNEMCLASFINEVPHWDASSSSQKTSFTYFTIDKDNAFYVATAAHLTGKSARVVEKTQANPKWATLYMTHVRDHAITRVEPSHSIPSFYEGKVFCPETSTGFFLMRRNGLISVTGNSGKGFQPQNLIRNTYGDDDIAEILKIPNQLIEILYGDIFETASKCIRGMILAEEGKQFFCADFASIEARVLAWLAGENAILDYYRNGLDIYKVNAVNIFNTNYKEVTKDQRFVGKVAELSLGYQGWVGAFLGMSEQYGLPMDKDKAKEIIIAWRAARQKTVAFWAGIENAALMTVKTKKEHSYGRIKFGIRGNFLHIRLPSGGLLAYAYPSIILKETPYGIEKEMITFWGVASDKDKVLKGDKHWGMIATYGGKLTENIVQAVSRDILAEAMLTVSKYGYPIVMHVHDEIVAELPADTTKTIEDFTGILSLNPTWAKDLPLKAEGWIGKRYRK